MCVMYNPTDVGLMHRNQMGQLDSYAEATDEAKDVVMEAQFNLLLYAGITLFLLRILYQVHGAPFWESWRVRILFVVLLLPTFILVGQTGQMFQISEEYVCQIAPSDVDMKFQNKAMEDLLQQQSDVAQKTFVLTVGMTILTVLVFFIVQI